MTTVYLVRHAHAGERSQWRGHDGERPLSERGEAQTRHLTELLAGDPVRRVVSSPSLRCVQTVAPIAEKVDTRLRIDDDLLEGTDTEAAIAVLRRHAAKAGDGAAAVLCSHGDVIPKVIRRLRELGMETTDATISQKGSMWVLELDGDRVVRGRYVKPLKPTKPTGDDAKPSKG